MSATFGPLFTTSSPSANLQRCLESRLRVLMDVNGSLEFGLTWKSWDMPAGEPICALRASDRRTGGRGCSGWPTPQANDDAAGTENGKMQKMLGNVAKLAAWPTPRTPTGGPETAERKQELGRTASGGGDLFAVALLAVPPELIVSRPSPDAPITNQDDGMSITTTPALTDEDSGICENGGPKSGPKSGAKSLAPLVGWATPRAEDAESAGRRHSRGVADTLTAQAGQGSTSYHAATGKAGVPRLGVLNPFFSLHLMGYPVSWGLAGICAWLKLKKR
jgi:hypothetical protein